MDLIGKKFEDSSGRILEISHVDGNVAHIKNSEARIAVERLLDHNYYSEYVDPESFFKRENSFYSQLTESVKSIPSEGMGNHMGGGSGTTVVSIGDTGAVTNPVESHSHAQKVLEHGINHPEDGKVKELQKRAEEMLNNSTTVHTNKGFEELIDENEVIPVNRNLEGATYDDGRPTTVTTYNENNEMQSQAVNNPHQNQPAVEQPVEQVNPIQQMFQNIKRSEKIAITVKLDEMIPKKDFIKMFEENYNDSVIEYLADEFYRKLMKDPSIIRDQISEAIKKKVFPTRRKTSTVKKSPAKKTATKKATAKKPTTKK